MTGFPLSGSSSAEHLDPSGGAGELLEPREQERIATTSGTEFGIEKTGQSTFDESGLHISNNEPYARRRLDAIAKGELEPGWNRVAEAHLPWKENPNNAEAWRYVDNQRGQRELEQHYAAFGIDDRTIDLVNPPDVGDGGSRTHNCGECARSVAALLNGDAQVARSLRPTTDEDGDPVLGEGREAMEIALSSPGEFARNYHGRELARPSEVDPAQVDPEVGRGFQRLREELTAAGPGSHAVVGFIRKPRAELGQPDEPSSDVGHWLNAVNADGDVVFIDSQRRASGRPDADFVLQYQREALNVSWIRVERGR